MSEENMVRTYTTRPDGTKEFTGLITQEEARELLKGKPWAPQESEGVCLVKEALQYNAKAVNTREIQNET